MWGRPKPYAGVTEEQIKDRYGLEVYSISFIHKGTLHLCPDNSHELEVALKVKKLISKETGLKVQLHRSSIGG